MKEPEMKNEKDTTVVYRMSTSENPVKLKKDIAAFERMLAEDPDDEQALRMLKKRQKQLEDFNKKI